VNGNTVPEEEDGTSRSSIYLASICLPSFIRHLLYVTQDVGKQSERTKCLTSGSLHLCGETDKKSTSKYDFRKNSKKKKTGLGMERVEEIRWPE
jgi:hypothetical protein